jgi:hypothetical protein
MGVSSINTAERKNNIFVLFCFFGLRGNLLVKRLPMSDQLYYTGVRLGRIHVMFLVSNA